MQLVEQHCISKIDPSYEIIDEAAFKSKNLYNAANYEYRQAFFHEGTYLNYSEVQKRMQLHEAYKALPAKVSQQILMVLDSNWKGFKEGLKAYYEAPSKFRERPHPPKYKHKTEGRNILIYTIQAISRGKNGLKRGLIKPSMLPVEIQTKQKDIHQVRIIPRNGYYVVEVVYSKKPVQKHVDPSFCVAIDLGVTNLVAITSNRESFIPQLVNGRKLKSINQWYNKRMKELKLCLPKEERDRTTKQMERITNHRNRQVNHYLHAASKRIIDFLVKEGVGTIIAGKNLFWKQEVDMGRRNNQNFVQIPHARFIDMLTYKAELVGIQLEIQEESYTSKASFLDLDPIPTYKPNDETEYTFSGKRIGRRNRLYCTKDRNIICADVNGSYNILRKSRPDAFAKGVAAYVVQPSRLAITV
ncbi:RNA-guided endonuclease InsQ/TnpB family protein [Ktedonobacter racemifer]|uniref:RNA-guided endonuclease InsQ/TnpB family protein n=1 Tax=Ktedonobacter racemifer TaxID=363277 RepID=UPI00058AC985|nr:RNA-guided endonuclease TnpB family protein [Ktedonobacter racemifer]